MKSVLLLFLNWGEGEGRTNNGTMWTSPLFFFIALVSIPVIYTQGLYFVFYRLAKCS